MIRVVIDFDPATALVQIGAADTQNPGVVVPPPVVFAVVNAGYITMLTAKIRDEIKGEDNRIVPGDGDLLRRLPRPPVG